MSNLFKSQCLQKEMPSSQDAYTRTGDSRIPINPVMQLRYATNMATIRPKGASVIEKAYKGVPDHASDPNSSPFYMTGGTKRSHKLD